MAKPNLTVLTGGFTLDNVRQSGRVQGYKVFVDTGMCVLGGGYEWCRIARLRSPK